MSDPKITKRIIISLIYVCIFSIIGILMYYFFSPKATCTDKIQNQGEKGIDCGGPCSPCKEVVQAQDINVLEKAVVFGGNDPYDAVFHIENPNNKIGAGNFSYEITLKDAAGNVIGKRAGTSFILPVEKKYIVALGILTEGKAAPANADIAIKSPTWDALDSIEKPALNIYSKQYSPLPVGVGSQVQALLRNESTYDLGKVYIAVILRDGNGKIIAVNSTEKNTLRSREERDFVLTWPYALNGEVKNIEAEAYSNVYDLQNFIRVK